MRCSAAVVALVASLVAPGGGSAPRELLPDLIASSPAKVRVLEKHGRFHLIFGSASANVGDGPLEIRASRPSITIPAMRADQIVRLSDGTARRYEHVGTVRFVVSTDHRHWHFLRYMSYDLRRVTGGAPVVRDRKTGFCLGDRYRSGPRLPATPAKRVFRGGCGFRQRRWLHVREGVSVGYGDSYRAELEGQYLDLTSVPAGRYRLVHTVNPAGALRERDRANDVAWVLLDLRWKQRRPEIRLLGSCAAQPTCSAVAPPAGASE